MARNLRQIMESVVFAGLKSGAPAAGTNPHRFLGPLRDWLERFLSGGPPPSDPLYLSRRTPRQRLVLALKIASPFLALAVIVMWSFRIGLFRKEQPKLDLSPAEIASKMLPEVDRIKIESNRDIDVPSVGVEHNGTAALAGAVRNNTSRVIGQVDVYFDVTDENGSKLGDVKAHFQNLAPKSEQPFRMPIEQSNAAIAIVREIRAQ
jgi:hypothetical protein